jgi:hypothetical protein
VQGPNTGDEAAYQAVYGLSPGQNYLISAWVMLGSGSPGTAFLFASDTLSGAACGTALITPTAQWQQVNCVYTATSNQAVVVYLVENAGSFSTYWDDVTVIPVPPVNGGFETGTFSQPWSAFIPRGGTGSISVSTAAAHSGTYGLAEGANSNNEYATQTVRGLIPGQGYVASAWVKLGSGSGGTVYLYADGTTGVNGGPFTTTIWENFAPSNVWINFLGYKW